MNTLPTIAADFLEAGSGPAVMLVHSSASGARQWRRLIDDLKTDFHVRAVNLSGDGRTPPWPMNWPQDAVMDETTPLAQWAGLLPYETLVASDPDTVLPVRALTALLRRACPHWTYANVTGGHMAPLTRPDLINPLVKSFLQSPLGGDAGRAYVGTSAFCA